MKARLSPRVSVAHQWGVWVCSSPWGVVINEEVFQEHGGGQGVGGVTGWAGGSDPQGRGGASAETWTAGLSFPWLSGGGGW